MTRAVYSVAHLSSTSPPLPPLALASHYTLQQLKDDDIQPLCVNLGRFKCLKKIDLVSRGM